MSLLLSTIPERTFAKISVDMSAASKRYRICQSQNNAVEGDESPSTTNEIAITPALVEAFLTSLKTLKISLRFFAGSWTHFDVRRCGGPYHVVMTSETIYRRESIPALISAMESACCGVITTQLPNHDALAVEQDTSTDLESLSYLCLVAAKVVYFGVGGGAAEFVRVMEAAAFGHHHRHLNGTVDTVWERQMGVGRQVLRIKWVDSRL